MFFAGAILVLPLTLGAAATAATTGTVSSFGSDEFGQLGDGAGGSSSTPVAVAGLTGVTQIDGGREQVVALKSDGTVWAWGLNSTGPARRRHQDEPFEPDQGAGAHGRVRTRRRRQLQRRPALLAADHAIS